MFELMTIQRWQRDQYLGWEGFSLVLRVRRDQQQPLGTAERDSGQLASLALRMVA
jgi:hypothetical protein